MRRGLLIQGPLLSVGRSGKYESMPLDDENLIVHFDCRKNILNIINNFGKNFDEIIVSTWDDGVFPKFNLSGKAKLFREKDLAINLPYLRKEMKKTISYSDRKNKSFFFKNYSILKNNNMTRQYYGTFKGLQRFVSIDTVIKIRTDQWLNIDTLLQFPKSPEKIYIPYLIYNRDYLEDLYFVGYYDTLLDFFEILSNSHPLSLSPHTDFVLQYAFKKYFNEIKVDKGFYNQNDSTERKKIFAFMLGKIFLPLPFETYDSLILRGDEYNREPNVKNRSSNIYFDGRKIPKWIVRERSSLQRFENVFLKSYDSYLAKKLQKLFFIITRIFEKILNLFN